MTREHVLTNEHVVGAADTVKVELVVGGQEFSGRVLAVDPELDLALVRIANPPSVAPLSCGARAIRGGQSVSAYGYGQIGVENSTLLATQGVISAFQEDRGLIVFDARVNPGNSGGPLVDVDGRWVGVVVAKSRISNTVDSMSFAVDGRAASSWARANGAAGLAETDAEPRGSELADAAVRAAVVRILVVSSSANTSGESPAPQARPSSARERAERNALVLANDGLAAARRADYRLAIQKWEAALTMAPSASWTAQVRRDMEEARTLLVTQDAERAAVGAEAEALPFVNEGLAHARSGALRKAVRSWETALNIAPNARWATELVNLVASTRARIAAE